MGTVYVLRHGLAESGAGKADEERRLSPEGIAGMGLAALGLKRLEITFDRVLSSPLIRAVQTAEAVQTVVAADVPIIETLALAPGRPATGVVKELQDHHRDARSI